MKFSKFYISHRNIFSSHKYISYFRERLLWPVTPSPKPCIKEEIVSYFSYPSEQSLLLGLATSLTAIGEMSYTEDVLTPLLESSERSYPKRKILSYSWLRRSLEEGRLLSLSAFESSKSRQQGRDTVSSPCFRPDSSRASAYCRQTSHKLARKPVQ